jgi:GNAT superfamily N-acetyltransferase
VSGDALGVIRRWYDERNLSLVVRITPLVERFDPVLADLGFAREGLTEVMTMEITAVGSDRTAITGSPSSQWMMAQEELQGVPPDLKLSWEGIINRTGDSAGFALHLHEGSAVAAGLAVRDNPWVGLFEINVASDHRRRGLGRTLSNRLLAWGAESGALRAYLQVVSDNQPARALYRSLGFKPAYRYWYRRAPVS